MNAAVLGCGPAGLLAAEALTSRDVEVDVFSVKQKSPHGGAQYLHRHIPGLTEWNPDGEIRYLKVGDAEGYAEKVYGDRKAKVSWHHFDEGMVAAWSMAKVYDTLWERWQGRIANKPMNAGMVDRIMDRYGLVVSTIPLPSICRRPGEHEFKMQDIILVPDPAVPIHNTIVYNGQATENWYRSSYLFGTGWTEYAKHADGPPIMGDRHIGFKPINNTCDCHPDVVRLGRFGKWQRDVLIHHAYEQALELI